MTLDFSTLPYYIDLDNIVPWTNDELIDFAQVETNLEEPVHNYYKKLIYPPTVLKKEFQDMMDDLVGAKMNKCIIWQWGASDHDNAHIDCNSKGEIQPFALNFVLSGWDSGVEFYDNEQTELKISVGDESLDGVKTENVTTYMAIDVSGLEPRANWAGKRPCIINASVPHIVRTREMRVTASIQWASDVALEPVYERIKQNYS